MGADNIEENTGNSQTISPQEADAIGEILNISMGSAATAVSTMLDRQVSITTPDVSVERFSNLDFTAWEPAMLVTIKYIEGIAGTNMMVFHKHDIQMIINMLMGVDDEPTDDFEFDELSMSAASEVMNQMMGSSATALSSFFAKRIDISTPEATILESEDSFRKIIGIDGEEDVVSISFKMTIPGVLDSDFINIMKCDLAKTLARQAFGDSMDPEPAVPVSAPPPPPAPEPSGGMMSQEQINAMLAGNQSAPTSAPPPPPPPAPTSPPSGGMMSQEQINAMLAGNQAPAQAPPPPAPVPQSVPQQAAAPMMGMMTPEQMNQMMLQQQMMMQQMAGQLPAWAQPAQAPPVQATPQAKNVSTPQFPNFTDRVDNAGNVLLNSNMDLMMGLPLTVSVEIGQTSKKIKDIMDFTQGTVIELEKQAGAPVDIIVNGHLIARGDVVVIDDNFGVRITEIIRTKV